MRRAAALLLASHLAAVAVAARLRAGRQPEVPPVEPGFFRVAVAEGRNPSRCNFTGYLDDCDAHLERIRVVTRPKPEPLSGSALVKIIAGSVNPHEWETLWSSGSPRSTYVNNTLGLDFAGVVEETGVGCAFSPGDEVWGTGRDNTDAEYAVLPCASMGRKPANLSWEEAASLPIVALTDYYGFVRVGAPWRPTQERPNGPTVLIIGGAGGTGFAAIQIAKALGAGKVITTCSPSHFDFVKSMGADEVIDYHTANWWQVYPKGSVDIIYDCIPQLKAGQHAYHVLSPRGRYVSLLPQSLAGPIQALMHPEVSQMFWLLVMEKTTQHLEPIKQLVESGKLKPVVDSVYGLSQIREAFEHSMGRHTTGKIVLRMDK